MKIIQYFSSQITMTGIQELQNTQKAKVFGLFQKQNKMLKMLHMCESGYQSMSCSVFHFVLEKKYLHTSLSFISPIRSLCLQIVLRTILVCCTDKTVSHRKKKFSLSQFSPSHLLLLATKCTCTWISQRKCPQQKSDSKSILYYPGL